MLCVLIDSDCWLIRLICIRCMANKKKKKKVVAEDGFDPSTSGLWAQHASTAPLCFAGCCCIVPGSQWDWFSCVHVHVHPTRTIQLLENTRRKCLNTVICTLYFVRCLWIFLLPFYIALGRLSFCVSIVLWRTHVQGSSLTGQGHSASTTTQPSFQATYFDTPNTFWLQ